MMKISAVLPVYSESASLRRVVDGLVRFLDGRLHEIILVVHPESSVESLKTVEQLKKTCPCLVVEQQKDTPGLGRAYRQGFSRAEGTHILMMDTDGEMDIATVPLMVEKMDTQGSDMVIASRWIEGGGAVGYNPLKYIFNRGFQIAVRWLFKTGLHDLTLGFKMFDRSKAAGLGWTSQFHEIAVETTLRPLKAGWRIAEVPTVWVRRKEGVSRNPLWRNFRYAFRAVKILREP